MVRLASWRYDNGLSCGEEANLAKYLAADAAFECTDRAMQTHGGFGYARSTTSSATGGKPGSEGPPEPGDGPQLRVEQGPGPARGY